MVQFIELLISPKPTRITISWKGWHSAVVSRHKTLYKSVCWQSLRETAGKETLYFHNQKKQVYCRADFWHERNLLCCYLLSCLYCLLRRCQCLAKETKWHPHCQARWEERVLPNISPVTSNCPLFQQKWPALAFKTSVQPDYWWQGPRDLPACLPAPASFELQLQIHCTYWNGM